MITKRNVKLKFGDIIINHWAGPNNPNRKRIVISVGKYINCIGKNGNQSQLINDKQTCISVIGNCFDEGKFDTLDMPYSQSNEITEQWHKDNPIKD